MKKVTKRLPAQVLGVAPTTSDTRGPGVRVTVLTKTLVSTPRERRIQEEVVSVHVDVHDALDPGMDTELALAIRTLAGVSSSFDIVFEHALRKIEGHKAGE